MSNHLFRVVFRGEISKEMEPEQVRKAVQTQFRCNEAVITRLFSGRPVIIKDKLDTESARNFQRNFEKTGAVCHIVSTCFPSLSSQAPPAIMTCPKCGFEQPAEISCIGCGVVIKKFRQRQAAAEQVSAEYHPYPPGGMESDTDLHDGSPSSKLSQAEFFRELILPDEHGASPTVLGLKAILLFLLLILGGRLVFASISSNYAGESFLHLINLPFHEAGHVIFRPLGTFMASLGGSLNQLLVPLICLAVLLLRTRDAFGASVCLWWFGENFLDLAPYINDARAGRLPLLGGNTGHSAPYGFHDWEFLLTETGLLQYDHLLARSAHLFGSVVMTLAILWGGILLFRQYQNLQED
jgi:hypothetical protein